MRNSFIFGVVWTAIIVLVVSFGVTVALLGQDSEEVESLNHNNQSEKQMVYETAQTAIRTNPEANRENEKNIVKEVAEISNNIDENTKTIEKIEEAEIIEVSNSNTKSFIRPVKGEALRPFSPNELIYSQTLEEWNTHVGTDFKAKLGDEVKAVQTGKVNKVASNDKYGEYIIIEHADGYESLYANITVLDAIREGNQVEQGQLIGYVAESFGFEVAEETHLHFELKKDGEYTSIEK